MGQIQSSFKRYEKKYLLTYRQYENFKKDAVKYLVPDEHSRYTICNIYYDTPDFELIRASIEKPVYKEKLRVRSYGVPGDRDNVFVELKKKYDGVVYKRRETMAALDAAAYLNEGIEPGADSQIHREIDWFCRMYNNIQPRVFIGYEREAYAGAENSELRVTFDTNLRWRDIQLDLRYGDYGLPLMEEGQVLMEIKIPGAAPLWLCKILSKYNICPSSFSKYGTCYKRYFAATGAWMPGETGACTYDGWQIFGDSAEIQLPAGFERPCGAARPRVIAEVAETANQNINHNTQNQEVRKYA